MAVAHPTILNPRHFQPHSRRASLERRCANGRGSITSRTTKKGEKHYYTAFWTKRPDGTRKQVWGTFNLRRKAEAYLDEQSRLVREGDYVEPSRMIFAVFAKEWLEKYPSLAETRLKDSTLRSYSSVIETHLLPFFGQMMLGQIKPSTIEKDFKSKLPVNLSIKTVRNILLILRVMFETAVQWDYLRSNPFYLRKKVKLPRVDRAQKGRALRPDEIRRLLDESLDDAYPAVATALFTGMRRGELFGVRWQDIDFERNQIHVKQVLYWRRGKYWNDQTGFVFNSPKTKNSMRRIDMSPQLRKLLLEHRLRSTKSEKLDLVFLNSEGNPVDPDNFVKRRFLPAVKAAGLGKGRFHDLRHTFGSLKIEQGENLKYVQMQMGHSSIKVTMDVYGHLLKDSNPEAAARTDALIFEDTASVSR